MHINKTAIVVFLNPDEVCFSSYLDRCCRYRANGPVASSDQVDAACTFSEASYFSGKKNDGIGAGNGGRFR